MDKKEIIKRLNDGIDALTIKGIFDIELFVAGSATISLRHDHFRQTMDIDLVKAINNEVRSVLNKFSINDNMAVSTDPNISDDFEYVDQAVDLIINKQGIKVYLVWEEFVLILKAFHAKREKDIQDVKNMTGKLDSKRIDKSLDLIIKSRERFGQIDPFKNQIIEVANNLKGGK